MTPNLADLRDDNPISFADLYVLAEQRGRDLADAHATADKLAHIIDDLREHAARNGTRSAAWERVREMTRVTYVNEALEAARDRTRAAWKPDARGNASARALSDRREVEASRKAIERWTEKANEAGAAYGDANSKHHAELDRANRLEAMCDRLAERLVERDDTIADVLALHEQYSGASCHEHHCAHCGEDYPCATVRAITPDAPASEANGRPLRSSSTEQED